MCSTNSTFDQFENCIAPYKCYHYINATGSSEKHKRGESKTDESYVTL